MSAPQPWPRRRPILVRFLALVALVNVVLGIFGIVQHGSTGVRWVIVALWLVVGGVCVLAGRSQLRRFDERAAARERDDVNRPGPV